MGKTFVRLSRFRRTLIPNAIHFTPCSASPQSTANAATADQTDCARKSKHTEPTSQVRNRQVEPRKRRCLASLNAATGRWDQRLGVTLVAGMTWVAVRACIDLAWAYRQGESRVSAVSAGAAMRITVEYLDSGVLPQLWLSKTLEIQFSKSGLDQTHGIRPLRSITRVLSDPTGKGTNLQQSSSSSSSLTQESIPLGEQKSAAGSNGASPQSTEMNHDECGRGCLYRSGSWTRSFAIETELFGSGDVGGSQCWR